MSVAVETLIFCDGRDSGVDCPLDGPYSSGDTRHERAAAIRKSYGGDGWRYIKGKDYCPHCVAALGGSGA